MNNQIEMILKNKIIVCYAHTRKCFPPPHSRTLKSSHLLALTITASNSMFGL